MKRFLLLAAACLMVQASFAQWINNFAVQPAAPTSSDTIRVIPNISFPSGDCNEKSQFHFVSGNHIYANAVHCLGMLTFICTTTDTFTIEPLPAGNYTFVFQVDAGQGPSPCTPGIVVGPTDSISFTVTAASSLPENSAFSFVMFPLPAKDQLTLTFITPPPRDAVFEILDISGKLAIRTEMLTDGMTVGLQHLSTGTYVARLSRPEGVLTEKKFSILR